MASIKNRNLDLLESYLDELRDKKRSEITISNYGRTIKHFLIESQKDIEDVTFIDVENWLTNNYEGNKESTFNQRLTVLNSFFKYCLEQQCMTKLPTKKRWFKKASKVNPNFLENNELAKIKSFIQYLPLRNRLILELLDCTGLRRSEIVKISVSDIDFQNRIIKVTGKGNRIGYVTITHDCVSLLLEYVSDLKDNQLFLFRSSKEKRLSGRQIYNITRKIGEKLGILPLGPHRFRHTLASRLVSNGADLETVKEVLRHRHIGTTLVYAHVHLDEFKKQYDRCMG